MKRTEVLVKNFENNPYEVPRFCFVGVAGNSLNYTELWRKFVHYVIYIFFVAGRTTLSLFAAYGITKYGVEAFSDALRREMSPWRVLVSVIEPGKFQTGITYQVADSVKQLWNNLSPEMKEDYEDKRLDGSKS